MYFENSIIVTHLLSSWQFWQGSGVPQFTVQWGIFTWSPRCSFVVRTKMSAAIALWRQPPGILTSKAWTLWLHMYFMCGPGQQQDMETSVDHLSSQLTQVMTCPLISFDFPWAKSACVTELCVWSSQLVARTVVCLLWENIFTWSHESDPRHVLGMLYSGF